MASVRRTAVLLAVAALLGSPAATPAVADPVGRTAALADGDAAGGVLLSLGSVLLLAGAAAASVHRRRPGGPAGPRRPGAVEGVASAAPGDGDG
ncbi:hypothetical protein ACFV1L_03155 [Kitasatospora sp. NPDC059646]|uniref:hypothetical protein n=1 Tax=Kitasatospora sp. NPDC059646 TaxID=3346893 RepID=UPI0036B38E77